jgi:pimeloyl-ACP methyl ester carboxylesterase
MGGRITLYLTQLMADKVEKLVLLAPDGLAFNFWRWLGTHTRAGSKFISYTIKKPGWAIWTLDRVEQLKMIPGSAANFVRYYMEDDDHRQMLYRRYYSTRMFDPSLPVLKKLIKKHGILVRMLFGKFDRIIPAKGGELFRKGMEELATVEVVDAGHNLLGESQAGKIVQLIND